MTGCICRPELDEAILVDASNMSLQHHCVHHLKSTSTPFHMKVSVLAMQTSDVTKLRVLGLSHTPLSPL